MFLFSSLCSHVVTILSPDLSTPKGLCCLVIHLQLKLTTDGSQDVTPELSCPHALCLIPPGNSGATHENLTSSDHKYVTSSASKRICHHKKKYSNMRLDKITGETEMRRNLPIVSQPESHIAQGGGFQKNKYE